MDLQYIRLLLVNESVETKSYIVEYLSTLQISQYSIFIDCLDFPESTTEIFNQTSSVILLGSDIPTYRKEQLLTESHLHNSPPILCFINEYSTEQVHRLLSLGALDVIDSNTLNETNLELAILRGCLVASDTADQRKAEGVALSEFCESNVGKLTGKQENIVLMTDDEGRVCYVNPKFSQQFCLDEQAILGSSFGVPLTNAGNALINIVRQVSNPHLGEMRVREVYRENKLYYLITIEDYSNYSSYENFFLRQKKQLAEILYSLGDGLIALNPAGEVLLMNQTAENLLNKNLNSCFGQKLSDLFPVRFMATNTNLDSFIKAVWKAQTSLSPARDCAFVDHTGTTFDLQLVGQIIRPEDGSGQECLLIIRDVTRLRKLESELIKQDKLDSIGVLAGGLAHDINNILTGVLGNISLARLYIDKSSEPSVMLDRAEKAISRARGISQQLLTFSKGGSPIRRNGNIAETVREGIDFALSGSNCTLNYTKEERLPIVEYDISQISQVIHNIATNAVQAMPLGGRLNTDLQLVELTRESLLPLPPGNYVRIIISDNGHGIPEKNLNKIFDPYFTTKQKGNGLGLATSYSIIQKHGGHISVDSILGEGSRFAIFLPVSKSTADPAFSNHPEIIPGSGRILLVDDELMVLETSSLLLEKLGYTCTTADNSQDAIAAFQEAIDRNQPFDMVILDLTLPGDIGGEKILENIKQIDPDIIGVVSSGYADNEVMAEYERFGFSGIAIKPYSIAEISSTIAELLKENKNLA